MARAAHVTTSAAVTTSPILVQGVHVAGGESAGTIQLRNGGSSDTVLVTLLAPAGTSCYVPLGEGVQFGAGLYVTNTSATGCTVFYRPARGSI